MEPGTATNKPAAYTESELMRVGVDVVDFSAVRLRCRRCDMLWTPRVPPCGRLPKNYWECPNGCNRPAPPRASADAPVKS